MRHGAHVPELRDDAPAGGMHRIRDTAPATNLLERPQAGRIGPAEALGTDRGRLGDDEARGGALSVVLRDLGRRHEIARARSHAGQRRHHDPIWQLELTHAIGSKQGLSGHFKSPNDGCLGGQSSARNRSAVATGFG